MHVYPLSVCVCVCVSTEVAVVICVMKCDVEVVEQECVYVFVYHDCMVHCFAILKVSLVFGVVFLSLKIVPSLTN